MAINIDDLVIDKILGIELISQTSSSDGSVHKIKITCDDIGKTTMGYTPGKRKLYLESEYGKSKVQEI